MKRSEIATILVVVCALLAFISCKQTVRHGNDDIKLKVKKDSAGNIVIHIADVIKSLPQTEMTEIHIPYDPFFKTTKNYKSVALKTILSHALDHTDTSLSQAVLVFECTDGYKPVFEYSKLYGKAVPYIAFKDVSVGDKNSWPDSVAEKFNPYYLVWTGNTDTTVDYPWPYGLSTIRILHHNAEYDSIYPYHNPALVNGFGLYKSHCIKCHSINKVGGDFGPEFNLPKNITEYRSDSFITNFAKAPNNYRYNSKMPPIKDLNDEQLQEILAYIKYMKGHKKQVKE